jgi:hypothetical protein
MNESEKEQREQSRRLMVNVESQHIQLQAQHDALLLRLQKRDAKDASERSGENAKSKTMLTYLMCFGGMQITI